MDQPAKISRPALPLVVMYLLVFAMIGPTYYRADGLSFLADDWVFLQVLHHDGPLGLWKVFCHLMNGAFFRPAGILPWLFDFYTATRPGAEMYHVTNILIHALNAFLLALFTSRVTRDGHAGMAAGMLFLVHPIQAEAVFWVSGRFDLLCLTFTLGSLYLYSWGTSRRGRARLVPASAAALLALLSKETGFALFGAAVALELTRFIQIRALAQKPPEPRSAHSWAAHWCGLSILGASIPAYFLLRWLWNGPMLPRGDGIGTGNIALHLVAMFSHLFLPAWPSHGPRSEWLAVLVLIIPVLAVACGILNRAAVEHLLPGLALMLLALAPGLAFPWDQGEWVGSRILYIPSAGLVMMLGPLFAVSRSRRNWSRYAAMMVGLAASFVFSFQLERNLAPFLEAGKITDQVLRAVKISCRDQPGMKSVYVADLPSARDGVMIFFHDNALSAAIELRGSQERWHNYQGPITAFLSGRVGREDYSMEYPASGKVLDGAARVFKWDDQEGKVIDLTPSLAKDMRRRTGIIAALPEQLPRIVLAHNGTLTGLEPKNGVAPLPEGGGFRAVNDDPSFESGIMSFDALMVDRAVIVMSVKPAAPGEGRFFAQLFWREASARSFDEGHSVLFPIIPDGRPHRYDLRLGRVTDFILSGKIIQLRLDPVNAAGEIQIMDFSVIPFLTDNE